MLSANWLTPLLLVASNAFMTLAWYGHLKFKTAPLVLVVLASWGIALIEYCLAVPANRMGSNVFTPTQLKTMQEVITLAVFVLFSWAYFGEKPTWSTGLGFVLISCGAFLIFRK